MELDPRREDAPAVPDTMLREFFKPRFFPWFGLCVVVAHSFYGAWVKRELNSWYGSFYDSLQSAGELGSGASPEGQESIRSQLWGFVRIVAPLLVVHPVSKFIRSCWVLEWRLTLVRSYLSRWDPDARRLEGSSQRIQEDTARLAGSFESAVATVLDSVLTLLVFIPVLLQLGGKAKPPQSIAFLGRGWLVVVATGTATLHLGGAWRIGKPLVTLEVANQRIEAAFRRRLVLDESLPAGVQAEDVDPVPMSTLVDAVRLNYMCLYRCFFRMNTFLGAFDQVMTLMPYMIVAPLLFAGAEERVGLGLLVKVSNSFDRVFGALTIVAENYGRVQDFRSTLHRLREFERAFAKKPTPSAALIPASTELSDVVQVAQQHYVDPALKGV